MPNVSSDTFKYTYIVTMKNGSQFTFSAYVADMPKGPMYYCRDRFGMDYDLMDQVSIVL